MYCIYDNLRTQLVYLFSSRHALHRRNPLARVARKCLCFVFRASFLHSRVAPYVNYERVAAYLFIE